MFPGALSTLLKLIQWILWVGCILLILPVLLNVPGRPTSSELALYVALLGIVVTYPALLPVLALGERGARLAGKAGIAGALRWCRRGLFVVAIGILGTFFGLMYARDANHPVPTPPERFRGSLGVALLYGETRWLQQRLDEGAGIDQRVDQDGYTAAMQAARFGSWRLVLFLLQRGADPDRTNTRGDSVRSLTTEGRLDPADPQSAAALAEVRTFLAR